MDKLAIVMAAGEGVRMKSGLPKVLHGVCGLPILEYVLRALKGVTEETVVVVGHGRDQVETRFEGTAHFVFQDRSTGWGTGHAVMCADTYLKDKSGAVIVTAGDMPLIPHEDYVALMRSVERGADAALLTCDISDTAGYGRIIRDKNDRVVGIVEKKDLRQDQERIKEINASVYCFSIAALMWALPQLTQNNNANEYYLTDVISILSADDRRIEAIKTAEENCMGINDRVQLAQAQSQMQKRIVLEHLKNGVTIINPDNVVIDADVVIGNDTIVFPGNVLTRGSTIGRECTLLPNNRIDNSFICDHVKLESSVVVDAHVGDNTTVGPFAYLRPDSVIGEDCRIGDFVEIKNSTVGSRTKVSHLTYVGDSDLGENINLGCGVVFVNYDGKRKQRTRVGNNSFIGCNVNLVAPVSVGENAYIAAGSTVTDDVPGGALAIARGKQVVKEGWVDKRKTEGKL